MQIKKIIIATLTAVALVTQFGNNMMGASVKISAEAASDGVSFATVKSVADFRSYIDNENMYSSQDVITTDWKGDTPVYTLEIPSDGTLLVCCLSPEGYAKAYVYSDFALTKQVGDENACSSDRDVIGAYQVSAGTYYYKSSRWNGTGDLEVTVFVGFIPADTANVTYADTSTKYDETGNVAVQEISSAAELAEYVEAGGEPASTDTVTTDWRGVTEAQSFTVKESGWLLVHPICENTYINFELFSDAGLTSRILKGQSVTEMPETPYSCYLSAGTYYYRGNRWNGTKELSFSTYLGFIGDSARFSLVSNNTAADLQSATVSFQGNGLIRIEKGEFDPANIRNDKFWHTENRKNAIEGTQAVLTENGNYVARLETGDGYDVMVPFTVEGLVVIPSPSPTVTPEPTTKPTGTPAPTVTPTQTPVPNVKTEAVYKVNVSKKTVTVKKNKKVKLKYTILPTYKGKVTFTSSNKKIATVSSKGNVTGKKKGKCKITIKINSKSKAVVTVKVK